MNRFVLAVAVIACMHGVAHADSWMLPEVRVIYSADRAARVTITPAKRADMLESLDEIDGRAAAGPAATASVERLQGGRWRTVWTAALVNPAAPVDVLLANDAKHLVTFDNWHSMGHGKSAVAVYDARGSLVRSLALTDMLPTYFVAALPHTVSSIRWRGDPRFSTGEQAVLLPIGIPADDELALDFKRTIDLPIALADGRPASLNSPKWRKALSEMRSLAAKQCGAERTQIAIFNNPIKAPTTKEERDWHHYLSQAHFRHFSTNEDGSASTTVLRPLDAADYVPSLEWLREDLGPSKYPDGETRMIGSPDMANLTAEIERIATGLKAASLVGTRLLIVANGGNADRIQRALRATGAQITIIDPKQSFPQRPDRMQRDEPAVCAALASSRHTTSTIRVLAPAAQSRG